MSSESETILMNHIVPRLKAAIPTSVKPVGCEDPEELVQDAISVAIKFLHSVEVSGKKVTPGNIAYYVILHMKSGRRSYTAGRTDAMAPATQLDLKSSVMLFEDEVGFDEEIGEPVTLGELLASEQDDPAMTAARDIDWDMFLSTHDRRYKVIIVGMLQGRTVKDMSKKNGAGYSRLYQRKQRMAAELQEFMGTQAIQDSARIPAWRASIKADREHAACAADRRRW